MKDILTVFVWLYASFSLYGQQCVEGIIKNAVSKEEIPFAQIYFPEEGLLLYADSSGKFSTCNIQTKSTFLEVRATLYRTYITEVNLEDGKQSFEFFIEPAFKHYPEVTIIGDRISKPEETPNNVETFSVDEMREAGAFSLSDGIAKIPGVDQLSTGLGISKPVIRGLFGNRIQTVMLGMRFDNQQWQDEHGLGLSDVGVDRIEIIKGPASLLYGSEAMGGVLNILEEKNAPINSIRTDLSVRYFSNTFGVATDFGAKGTKENFNWRIRGGYESHADYSEGLNQRILNSRFGGYYATAGIGFRIKNLQSRNNYFFSANNFGFIMEPSMSNLTLDNRQSRSYDMPHHSVYLHAFSSQNTFFLNDSKLKVTLGAQYNDRQEQEGGSKISLDMILTSFSAKALWLKKLTKRLELNIGTQQEYQNNQNVGSRTIVPDANLLQSSLLTYLKYDVRKISIEGGLRYDLRGIQTFETGIINIQLNNPGQNVTTFNKYYSAVNGSLGMSYFNQKHLNLKATLSSGYRAGNLAELSSNGLHEGSVRYEIGNINLKTEQNICADIYAAYENKFLSIISSVYANRFFNYIYLAPTSEEYIGFQIYRYLQKNALLTGNETTLEIHPDQLKWIRFKSSYSIVIGKTDAGEYLPFIPAQKIQNGLTFTLANKGVFKQMFFTPSVDYVFAQNHPGQFETATGDYTLFNASVGCSIERDKKSYRLSIAGTNLFNKVYYSHLSRYKYFDIYNIGRNININLKIEL